MKATNIGVIGATGKTGYRVSQRLKEMGIAVRDLARNTSPGFDWTERSNWAEALKGLDSLYVTYHPDLAVPQAQADIEHLLSVAQSQHIEHIVLLSGRGEDGARAAEVLLEESGVAWNVVRASWFMQNFSESFMLDGVLERNLVLPQPKASEPFIDVDDIADVAVAALIDPSLRNQLFEITGSEILSFDECMEVISEEIGEHVELTVVPLDAYLEAGKAAGMTDDMAWLIQELFSQVLDGRNEYTTSTIEQVLGKPARTFRNYVKSVAKTSVWKAPQAAANA
jgi:uncharacterized protein YbjT (DUF2867 family)